MSDVAVCQSDYLAAEDLGSKQVTVTIRKIEELPREEKERSKKRNCKDVVLWFEKARKAMRCNPTNQWSIALLLGSKSARDWVGKRVTLRTDEDADLESGGMTLCIRLAGSPDATPERATAYRRAWEDGNRTRGNLAKRLKRAYRLQCAKGEPELDGPDGDDEPRRVPPGDPDMGNPGPSYPEPLPGEGG